MRTHGPDDNPDERDDHEFLGESPPTRTHHPHQSDWKEAVRQINGDTTPELVYIGSKTGYYMPVPWSEQDSFDAHDKDTPTLKGVYFVQAEDSGMVKVGWSTNVYRRMHALQTGSPSRLRLLGVLDVDQAVERIIHVQYGHLRAHGEWFHPQVTEALHAHPRAA